MRFDLPRVLVVALLAGCGFMSAPVMAQVAADAATDSSSFAITDITAATDSSATDSAASVLHQFSDDPYAFGAPVDSTLPGRGYHLDMAADLSGAPEGFVYSLGNLGWPHEWGSQGLPPSAGEFTIDGVSIRDPATNRALLEVAPVDVVESPRPSHLNPRAPSVLAARIRPLDFPRPYSELRYENGGAGLQSISAMHVQERLWRMFGAPTVAQFVARFGFHEWTGQYPNSASNLSQVFGRVGFTSKRWRIRFTDSYTLRTRGAHSGVLQKPGQGFDSVYDRFDATVGDPSANQRLQRNQFDVSVEHTWIGDVEPLAVSMSFVKSLYRYTNQTESETRSSEFHLNLVQAAPEFVAGHRLSGLLSFQTITLNSDGLLSGGGGASKSRLLMSADDRFTIAGIESRATLGIATVDEWVFPTAGLSLRKSFDRFDLAAEGSIDGVAPSPLEVSGGMGVQVSPNAVSNSTMRSGRITLTVPGSTFAIRASGFVSGSSNATEIIEDESGGSDYRIAQVTGTVTWAGLDGSLDWRSRQRRGFYGSLSPTIQASSGPSDDEVAVGLANSLPSFYATLRLGFRNQYFKGDLDADFYVIGRYWSAFGSRAYNPVHALLVLPAPGTDKLPGTGTVDVRFEGGIREATVFVSVDNALADFVYPGAMIVPVYPLPARAFRFGIVWPING